MLLQARTLDFLTRVSADVIFGAIVLSAVIGSLSDPLPNNRTVILTTFLSLQVISWAKAYARKIGDDMANRRISPWSARWRLFFAPSWMMVTTAAPVLAFGLAAIGLISQNTALITSEVMLLTVLMFFGFISRHVSGGGTLQSLLTGASVTLLGYVAIQIKLWTRYLPTLGQ
jgi:hypothetical protein